MVEAIEKSYPKNGADIGEYKAFVAKCIMCHMMERTYRFVLAGRIAEYALKHGCSPDAYNKELFAVYFGQTQDDTLIMMGRKKQLDKNGRKVYAQTHYALGTIGYDEIIESIFTMRDSDSESLIRKEIVRRTAIVNLIGMLYSVCPCNRGKWKDADFKEAADFFCEDYPILCSLMKLEVFEAGKDKEGQTYYDYYHSYYMELLKDESTQTKRIIETMT